MYSLSFRKMCEFVLYPKTCWWCFIIYAGVCSVVFLTKAKPCKLNEGAPPLSCSVAIINSTGTRMSKGDGNLLYFQD